MGRHIGGACVRPMVTKLAIHPIICRPARNRLKQNSSNPCVTPHSAPPPPRPQTASFVHTTLRRFQRQTTFCSANSEQNCSIYKQNTHKKSKHRKQRKKQAFCHQASDLERSTVQLGFAFWFLFVPNTQGRLLSRNSVHVGTAASRYRSLMAYMCPV